MLKRLRAKSGKNQKGFTLIELLAVIVILAIIAAIAIPSVISIINKQNDKAAVQDGLTIIHAAKLYVADHNNANTSEISSGDLQSYLETANLPSGATYSVSVSNGIYTLTYNKLPSNGSWGSDNTATEQELLQYNGAGNSSGSSSGNS
ncbi:MULTISPECIES: prepilin-type N-terminal cleavage/methylation domain-containing protein [unclassified Sporolactobacillus]|uniref:prepilin-type N-terminal cleavage/methylation domain-containing protein n=1 Tax=unclassified Sporolactobacillus TaxID=2628533 RepID=UPI002368A977|nr:prepilin-type N-terminal cleavage/methylation domain-containing protein [Sporolactobacillus sp. CQH2019]MDD9147656.1 prepilin-type N-terminal cleavage/methylation domain-containing protein [Sporolactobacillus sp. CQH2019]